MNSHQNILNLNMNENPKKFCNIIVNENKRLSLLIVFEYADSNQKYAYLENAAIFAI